MRRGENCFLKVQTLLWFAGILSQSVCLKTSKSPLAERDFLTHGTSGFDRVVGDRRDVVKQTLYMSTVLQSE